MRQTKEKSSSLSGVRLSSMKTATDPRHKIREQLVQKLFAVSFHKDQQHGDREIKEIYQELNTIDAFITKAAPEWPLEKIARVDLAILRLAVYELTKKRQPPKVIIDEAVELAKEFGGETSPGFINGALGTVYSWLDTEKVKTS